MSKMYIEYMYIIIYILSYIYGSYSPELGEDIELFCVVQDFCLVTVHELLVCHYVFLTLMCKKLYLYQNLDCVSTNLSKIENKSVKIEKNLLLTYNFTDVVIVKYSTS